jgi:hypothetical protein
MQEEFGTAGRSYWCALCGKLHKPTPGSEEQIMRTGWRTYGDQAYNVGFCNGVHSNPTTHLDAVRPAKAV